MESNDEPSSEQTMPRGGGGEAVQALVPMKGCLALHCASSKSKHSQQVFLQGYGCQTFIGINAVL